MSIALLHRVQTVKEIRREQISNASTPVNGNFNYMRKPSYMGCWSVKVESTQCKLECHGQWKKWNRDLMAVCNFRRIWDAYLNGRERPNDLKVQPRNGDGDDVVGGVGNRISRMGWGILKLHTMNSIWMGICLGICGIAVYLFPIRSI